MIHCAAGKELVHECRLLGGCKPGQAKVTCGYKLAAKHIVHTVGPVWRGGENGELELLASYYRESLSRACEISARTVGIPAISTGIFGYPMNNAAVVAITTVIEYPSRYSGRFDRIAFVCFDTEATTAFERVMPAHKEGLMRGLSGSLKRFQCVAIGGVLALALAVLSHPVVANGPSANQASALAGLSSTPMAQRTPIAILATPHLIGMKGFEPKMVRLLADQLGAWQPAIVGIEALPASEIELMRLSPAFAEVVDAFVGRERVSIAENAQSVLSLGALEANARVDAWRGAPSALSNDERHKRALHALAAYRPETALLYFDAEVEPLLFKEAASYLRSIADSSNERVVIAVRIARTLGLPALTPIDSHLDKDVYLAAVDDLQLGLSKSEEASSITSGPPYSTEAMIREKAVEQGDLRPLYAFLNSPEFGRDDVRAQFDLFNRIPFSNGAGRVRQAAWDERNLRIAAHIRHAAAKRPGQRVLVLIGAGHKPFLDAILSVSLDTKIVDTKALMMRASP